MNTPAPIRATGRRKTATAQVRIVTGSGAVRINGKSIDDFFQGNHAQKQAVMKPMQLTNAFSGYDAFITVRGGGITGQAGAIVLGIARVIKQIKPDTAKLLRTEGFLTRDPRMVERKKPGRPKARKRFQFSKR